MLEDPPTREELAAIAASVPGGAKSLLTTWTLVTSADGTGAESADDAELDRRTPQRSQYRDFIGDGSVNDESLLTTLSKTPDLLHKPLFTDGHRAIIGFELPEFVRWLEELASGDD